MKMKYINDNLLYPEDWQTLKLKECADIQSGYAFKKDDFQDNGIPVIKIKNIEPPKITLNDIQFVSDGLAQKKKQYQLNYNDILISLTGSNVNQFNSAVGKVGRVRIKNRKMILNQRVGRFLLKEPSLLDYDYLYHYISTETIQYKLASSAAGSANQANISPAQILSLDINLPPLPEQRAIAEILSSIDDKIELNNQMNRTLEAMAQAIFKQWFVDFEFPASSTLPLAKGEMSRSDRGGVKMIDSELGPIPEGWRVGKTSDIVEVTDYVANGSFQSLRENVTYLDNEGYAILIRLVDYNRNFNGDFQYIDEKGYEFLKKTKLIGGEIIISNVGANAGTVFKVPKLKKKMTLGPNSVMLINNLYTQYLYLHFLNENGQHDLRSIIAGSAQPKFNKTDFRNIKILIPENEIIKSFNKLIEPIFEKIDEIFFESQTLSTLRDSLLPKLMSGELRVPEEIVKRFEETVREA